MYDTIYELLSIKSCFKFTLTKKAELSMTRNIVKEKKHATRTRDPPAVGELFGLRLVYVLGPFTIIPILKLSIVSGFSRQSIGHTILVI